jgi:hypothetical protein
MLVNERVHRVTTILSEPGEVDAFDFNRNVTPLETGIRKLHGLSPRANYTDRATAACGRSDCQLLRIKGATWSG